MNRKTFLRGIAAGLLLPQLAGCSLPKFLSFKGTRLNWKSVTLSAADGANQNSPVLVDVVLVLEDSMMDRLVELPAAKWFAVNADLLKTFPLSMSYRTWELVPGQTMVVPGDAFGSPRVVGVLVYADYTLPGNHRLRVETLKGDLTLRFDTQTFTVSAVE